MDRSNLNSTLKGLAGHLQIDTKEDQRKFASLSKSLAKAAISPDLKQLKTSDFSFEKTDLFLEETIPEKQLKSLDKLIKSKAKEKDEPEFRMFVREVPVREKLIHGSVADWAGGAKVDHSIGPFLNKDGRQFWYDFFPILKLVALYITGISDPVLLFKVKPTRGVTLATQPGPIIIPSLTKTYTLAKGSIWINAQFLAPNAPPDRFTGLTIKGGKVTLSTKPKTVNKKLTVSATTKITVDLSLDQQKVTDADEISPFGKDARSMELELPKNLKFQFSGQGRSINSVGDANCNVYGHALSFNWDDSAQVTYDTQLQRILFPLNSSLPELKIGGNESEFHILKDTAPITRSAWALEVATIDITQPIAAGGTGALFIQCKKGLSNSWKGIEGGNFALSNPAFLLAPGQILVADLQISNPHVHQRFDLWSDELNTFGTHVDLHFNTAATFFYTSAANGTELLMTFANADFKVDRPVCVNGQPPEVQSRRSLLILAANATDRLIYLFDDNLIQDAAEISEEDPFVLERMALAMTNALFKVSQPNGCLLFGALNEGFTKVEKGFFFLTFGLFAYIPTLPDPYAANLGILRQQIRGVRDPFTGGEATSAVLARQITAWLVCRVAWNPPADETELDTVNVSFHFAPLNSPFSSVSLENDEIEGDSPSNSSLAGSIVGEPNLSASPATPGSISGFNVAAVTAATSGRTLHASTIRNRPEVHTSTAAVAVGRDSKPLLSGGKDNLPDYGAEWDRTTNRFRRDLFSLLDVSTNADLFGISFDLLRQRETSMITTHVPSNQQTPAFPLQVEGMDVVSPGSNVKAFTVPQISWEPLFNLSPKVLFADPPPFFNYYPDDGGPMHILNNGEDTVTLAPLPLTDYLIKNFKENENFKGLSMFTLPFGMKALSLLEEEHTNEFDVKRPGTKMRLNSKEFQTENAKGGLQLQVNAGAPIIPEQGNMFKGSCVQLTNVRGIGGGITNASTLGHTVTEIFNNEFLQFSDRGAPVSRIDLSGYGASCFSNWLNPEAAFAQTSQAKFDVMVGRCSHEIVQVVSMIYPWGIKVVRTVTIFRVGSGYVYRIDSGWKADSAGKFDFRFFVNLPPDAVKAAKPSPFNIHPGIINGLYNVSNIVEVKPSEIEVVQGTNMVAPEFVDQDGIFKPNASGEVAYKLQPVYFDADIDIEGVTEGFKEKEIEGNPKKIVPSKKILGYVHVAPIGMPITDAKLKEVLDVQAGSIGGPIDCEIELAESKQKMRLNRFDLNNSVDAGGNIIFAGAGKGSVLLPKDGSWSMVKHERSSGEVSPVSADLSIPVIRQGLLDPTTLDLDTPIEDVLLRIANPLDLLRQPVDTTLNYGFIQNTDTQKALFLTPAFKKGTQKLLSKTPPLFADAFRIVNTKSIFPNIGKGEIGDFGEVVDLLKDIDGGDMFDTSTIQDLGKDVLELIDISDTVDGLAQQGYDLLKDQVKNFKLPDTEFDLINLGDDFRLYIEYKNKENKKGDLDFNFDSLANDLAETAKSKMENIGLVVDLAGINRLMTVYGKWDSEKGSEASYPKPELVFSDELQPVIDILEILQQLQGEDYAGAISNGLKLAMSNKAGSWEYKFEASKEIPVLRFPVPDAVYNDPNTPFKLEAGLTLGAYFNAAIEVSTSGGDLKPSAGGSLGFYGKLSVMCVSISAATIYAIGQVNLDIAADTKIGPSLKMKFGFGAQIVVGLPVAGNVSVSFVVGVEIFAASGQLDITAFMIFEGHAEILGGLVSITIRIEAKGTISKKTIGAGESRTDMACQVTFGLDISIFLVINISFSTSWQEQRQIA